MSNIAEPLTALAVAIDGLALDPANTRVHDSRNLYAIKGSLEKFGQRKPVVVQKQGMIVRAGNGMVMAAKELGWTEIAAVIVAEGDVEATAFSIADNRTGELSEWEPKALAETLAALQNDDSIDQLLTGFTDEEIEGLISGQALPPDADGKGYDESCADDVRMTTCPKCGHEYAV